MYLYVGTYICILNKVSRINVEAKYYLIVNKSVRLTERTV